MTKENLTTVGSNDESTGISLELLSKITGFPSELIAQEIFKNSQTTEEISLSDLRIAMLNYIDASLLINKDK